VLPGERPSFTFYIFSTLTGRTDPAGGKPMWTAKWILDAYEGGDEEVRIEMYLAYRELRLYFDEIEARPEKTNEEKVGLVVERSAGAWWNHCCRLVRG
jgi:hypothetical protein